MNRHYSGNIFFRKKRLISHYSGWKLKFDMLITFKSYMLSHNSFYNYEIRKFETCLKRSKISILLWNLWTDFKCSLRAHDAHKQKFWKKNLEFQMVETKENVLYLYFHYDISETISLESLKLASIKLLNLKTEKINYLLCQC